MPEPLTVEQILHKLETYCAYQERCHAEVSQKLHSLGAFRTDKLEIIAKLIDGNYLNEERFARAFVRGKHRIKHWGRIRIKQELKLRDISSRLIDAAMTEIDPDQYDKTFEMLCERTLNQLAGQPLLKKKKKFSDYLLRKGYETFLVYDAAAQIKS